MRIRVVEAGWRAEARRDWTWALWTSAKVFVARLDVTDVKKQRMTVRDGKCVP